MPYTPEGVVVDGSKNRSLAASGPVGAVGGGGGWGERQHGAGGAQARGIHGGSGRIKKSKHGTGIILEHNKNIQKRRCKNDHAAE